jgi:CRISPR-associated protein Cmr3
MNTWYELTALDTLFFRGSEPMEAGQATVAPLFPPPVTVIQGALRTAMLRQHCISFSDYKQGNVPNEVVNLIGKCGEAAPFTVTAILLKYQDSLYAPAPASWFIDAVDKPVSAQEYIGSKVITATSTAADAAGLGVISSSGQVSLVLAQKEALPLAGCWVDVSLFAQESITLAQGDLLTAAELFATELRTGIEIDSGRKVVEGKLYSANHIRLRDGVTMLIAVDTPPGLADSGLLQLGGEQRKCRYELLAARPLFTPVTTAKGFVALAPIVATADNLNSVAAAYKPVITSGWDLSKGFHKPSAAWYPAGSVFSKQINDACIPIAL